MKLSTIFTTCIIPGVLVFASVVYAEEVSGIPGVDYPNYHSIPQTSFSCSEQKYIPGFYADLETQCQAFHFCFKDRQESFLCPTGTIFNQATLACDVWHASNCSLAPILYSVNAGPAVESAGRKLPMLMKLRSRSQGKPATPPPSIFEKISSLYEGSADPTTMSEALEASNFSGEFNEVSNANSSEGKSGEASTGHSEAMQNEGEQLSEVEQNLEGNVAEEYQDSESMTEEIDDESDMDPLYNPVTGGYYMGYNPYQAEWRYSEPMSEEFKNFYNYENPQDRYEGFYENPRVFYENSESNDNEDEPLPENDVGQGEFLKRQLKIKQRQRKRPMYIVVEDEEDAKSSSDGVLGDDPAAQETSEQTEVPLESATEETAVDETSESSGGRVRTEEEKHRESLGFTLSELPFSSPRPLTADELSRLIHVELVATPFPTPGPEEEGRLIAWEGWNTTPAPSEEEKHESDESERLRTLNEENEDMLSDAQGDDPSVGFQDETYESDSFVYDLEEGEQGLASPYEESESFDRNEVDVPESTSEDTDDTLLVIPEDSDAEVPDPNFYSEVADEAEDEEYVTEGYAYEEEANDQDVENLGDESYDYENGYRYYKYNQGYPESYETAEPPYESPEFDYGGPYGRQYLPHQMYGAGRYDVDYANYSPEELAYLASLRNRNTYTYMQQQYQEGSYMDPTYGTGSEYYQDDPYAADLQNSNYYESDEESDYYTQTDPWVRQHASDEYVKVKTGSPLPVDITEADLITDAPLPLDVEDIDDGSVLIDINSNTVEEESSEDVTDFSPDDRTGNQKEEYYVFDFDEDNEENERKDALIERDERELKIDDALLEPDDDQSLDQYLEGDYSESLDLKEILESKDFQRSESVSNENITVFKDGNEMSSESNEMESNGERSLDGLLSTHRDDVGKSNQAQGEAFNQPADTWSSFVTESSPADKPVTLSSAFERLATLNSAKAPKHSGVNMDFSSDPNFFNNMAFSESMDFGPYGYGASMGQQFNTMNAMQPNKPISGFSHRTGGGNEQSAVPRLSSIQEKLRSMKQGKFGVFKKYMSSMRGQN